MTKFLKRPLSIMLAVLMVASLFAVVPMSADAVKKKKVKSYVKSLSVSKRKLTLNAGKSANVKVKVSVSGKASKKFTVKSSNAKIAEAKVSGSNVKIIAKKPAKKSTVKVTVTSVGKNSKKKKISKTIAVVVNAVKKKTTKTVVVTPKLEKISVSLSTNSISVGGTAQLTVTSATSGVSIANIEYSSSNDYLATVNKEGIISGWNASAAPVTIMIRAYDSNGNVATETVSITVSEAISATVTGVDSTAVLYIGETKLLNPIASGAEPNFTYYSTNTSVASVNENGVITALSEGTADIIVTINGTNATAVCALTVKGAALGIKNFYPSHASVLRIDFTTSVSEGDKSLVNFTFKNGEDTINLVPSKWSADGRSVEFTNGADLNPTTYSVTISSNNVSIDSAKAYATCKVEKRRLDDIVITSARIPKANGAKIYFDALDQYDDPIENVTGDTFNWHINCKVSVKNDDIVKDTSNAGYIIIRNLGTFDDIIADEDALTVKADWKDDPEAITTTKRVDIKNLVVQHITIDSVLASTIRENASDKTYTLNYTAVDQYGSPIDWEVYLNGGYNNSFEAFSSNMELVSAPLVFEGKLVVKVYKNQKGSAKISIQGFDLQRSTLTIDVLEASKPMKVRFEKNEYILKAGDEENIKARVTFIDQYNEVMSAGAVTEKVFKDNFTKIDPSSNIGYLDIAYESSNDGDFIVFNASDMNTTEEAVTGVVYFTAWNETTKIESTVNVTVQAKRTAGSVVIDSAVPKDMVKGEVAVLEYEIRDQYGKLWTEDTASLIEISSNKFYISLDDDTITLDKGKGHFTITANETSFEKGDDDLYMQFALKDKETGQTIAKSSTEKYPIVIYDNVDRFAFDITSAETEFLSGQTINASITAYNNNKKLDHYNKVYRNVLFSELKSDAATGKTKYVDLTFVNGVATIQLPVYTAGDGIRYATDISAIGVKDPLHVVTSKSIKVKPSNPERFKVEINSGELFVTCIDLNGNTVTEYNPTSKTTVVFESQDLIKSEDYINGVDTDNKTGKAFENGVLTLSLKKNIPNDTVIKIANDTLSAQYTVR